MKIPYARVEEAFELANDDAPQCEDESEDPRVVKERDATRFIETK